VASRGMQNLTAHYNILYNAKELVNESERNIQLAYSDNYDRVIPVYKEPNETLSQAEIKKLDDAILKANTIANEKSLSKYVDDAYFLIGKANHLKSNFFNAVEFFNYVYNNYPQQKEIRQAALAWKARSLIASDRLEEAESTLDTALKNIRTEKKSVADIYAAQAQLRIYARQDTQAISLLEKAIETAANKQKKIRWTYLTAQLQEITDRPQEAVLNYTKVIKSNAPFDMAFNANLSRINLKSKLSGDTSGRTRQIIALLKDDKNRELIDQIYFQIAESYSEANNTEKAIENYNLTISKSTKNIAQKGLAYLRLAEIYFDQSDFLRSKAYYDSTITALPKNYPDYQLIKKKADNLELLADRLSIIAREDTLQMLAKLPDSQRKEKVSKLVLLQTQKEQLSYAAGTAATALTSPSQSAGSTSGDSKFYFNNSVAINQGLAEFKRRWGNRKQEDNWRRSQKSAGDMPDAIPPVMLNTASPFQQMKVAKAEPNMEALIQSYLDSIPMTPEQKTESNLKIASALYDIANYYRDVAADTAEAVKIYEQLLKRFPENVNKLATYYNLYRLYSFADKKRSDEYKNILLSQYPDSPFARIILDPQYSQKIDEQEFAFNRFYNDTYNQYVAKGYHEVLRSIEKFEQVSEKQKVPAQLAYLYSLALGHTQKLPELENAFKKIVFNFPDDKLIVPLIKQHLAFIDSNRVTMEERIVALSEQNMDKRFIQEPEIEQPAVLNQKPAVRTGPASGTKEKSSLPEAARTLAEEETGIFRKEDAADHYFVVNIADPSVNLSSSRFGIGQFNRANLPGSAIKHQLKPVSNENQLIFVGPFSGKEAATTYLNNIAPLMRDIMKIPAGKYSIFLINHPNLDKIIDKETLELYVEYYKKNY
jgi:tetratricopeptide (TPR) repeat protein